MVGEFLLSIALGALTLEDNEISKSKPIILLDVDGVINMVGRDKIALQLWPDCVRSNQIKIRWCKAFDVFYSPAMIQRINQWNKVAEIRWLTSWNDAANDSLAPAVGLDQFVFARDPKMSKLDYAVKTAEEVGSDTLVIWIDDELIFWKAEHEEALQHLEKYEIETVEMIHTAEKGIFNRKNTVFVSPRTGLTVSQVDLVDKLLSNPELCRDCVTCELEEGSRYGRSPLTAQSLLLLNNNKCNGGDDVPVVV